MSKKENSGLLNGLKNAFLDFIEYPPADRAEKWDTEQDGFEEGHQSEFRLNETISSKVRLIISDFIEAAPLIEAAGFRIRDLEVELSVIPKLIPHFEKLADVDDAKRLQIIEQVQDKRIISLLLKALFKADNFQKSLSMGNLEFAGIEIEITAIPAIRLRYQNPLSSKEETTDLTL
ncbi:MAG: hypothetical protein DRQ47_05410 [Gammaproteobacteria bacterium]|nr:MAG: hypothetical protein DRQ47_05410 [Gammaproteobacteria bacterium]